MEPGSNTKHTKSEDETERGKKKKNKKEKIKKKKKTYRFDRKYDNVERVHARKTYDGEIVKGDEHAKRTHENRTEDGKERVSE